VRKLDVHGARSTGGFPIEAKAAHCVTTVTLWSCNLSNMPSLPLPWNIRNNPCFWKWKGILDMKKVTLIVWIVAAASLVINIGCMSPETSKTSPRKEINIGITSSDDAKSQKDYAPFNKLIAEKTGKDIVLKTYPSLDKLCKASGSGDVDFLILSPTDYLKANKASGAKAVATKLNKGGTPYCQGTVLAAKNGKIKSVTDLKGKTFRFGPDGSFNKYYAVLMLFSDNSLNWDKDLKSVSYGTGCGGIAGTILKGEADAGVVCDYSWNGWKAKNSEEVKKLAVIGLAPRLRDKAIAASRGVDKATTEQFVKALVSLKDNPVILQPPLKARGFSPSTDKDYDSLRTVLSKVDKGK